MSRSAVLEDENAHEVDQEAEDGDDQQPLVLDLWGLHQPLHGLGEDEEGDEKEEKTVDKAGQGLCSDVTKAVLIIGLPLGDDCGYQTSQQACAVEKHVKTV